MVDQRVHLHGVATPRKERREPSTRLLARALVVLYQGNLARSSGCTCTSATHNLARRFQGLDVHQRRRSEEHLQHLIRSQARALLGGTCRLTSGCSAASERCTKHAAQPCHTRVSKPFSLAVGPNCERKRFSAGWMMRSAVMRPHNTRHVIAWRFQTSVGPPQSIHVRAPDGTRQWRAAPVACTRFWCEARRQATADLAIRLMMSRLCSGW